MLSISPQIPTDRACELIAETGKSIGMDLVEVNSVLNVQNQAASLAWNLLSPRSAAAFGMDKNETNTYGC